MEWEIQLHTFVTLEQDASGQLHALVSSLQGRKSVCVHLIGHLLVIRNYYYDFHFAVLFKVQTQRLCYSGVACPMFASLKLVLVAVHFLAIAEDI